MSLCFSERRLLFTFYELNGRTSFLSLFIDHFGAVLFLARLFSILTNWSIHFLYSSWYWLLNQQSSVLCVNDGFYDDEKKNSPKLREQRIRSFTVAISLNDESFIFSLMKRRESSTVSFAVMPLIFSLCRIKWNKNPIFRQFQLKTT